MLRKFLLLLLVSVSVFLLFKPAFGSYFFQDDWFSLIISKADTVKQFLSFFTPRIDVVYYRPLGMQVPFFINSLLFGINPLPFRIATLLIHLLNGYFVYGILDIILRKKHLAVSGALFYLFSASQMIIFYWAATFAFVLGPFFYFGAFLYYLKNNKSGSLIMFILGLLINELLITLPIILIVWEFLQSKKSKLLVNIKRITVFGIPMVLYLLFRLTLAAPTKAVSYTYLNSIKQLLFNIRNYLFWSFNWPDEISNQFITFFKFNPVFLANFKKYVILFSMETFIILIFFALIPLFYLIIKKGQVREIGKIGLIGIIWFVITISPVLYYSQHAFPYYLPIPLVGLLITGLVLYQNWEKQIGEKWSCAILISSLIIWYWSSWTNIRLNEFIHWAPRRSLISKTITKNMLQFYPTLPLNTTVFMPYADENKWALGDQNALKFLYSDDIRTFYGNHPEYLKINNGSQFEKFIDYHE